MNDFVHQSFLEKGKKVKQKNGKRDLVSTSTADLRRNFSKGETSNWSCKLYKIPEIISDTIPSLKTEQLSEISN